MNKRAICSIILIGALGLGSCHYPRGPRPSALDEAERICHELVRDGHTPGIVLLIGQGDRILMRRAWGRRMTHPAVEAMTEDTVFDLASLTKPTATASAVMFLVQDGRVDPDQPVARYLSEFDRPDKAAITVRQLLTHTSGLPAYTSMDAIQKAYGVRPRPDAVLRRISELPLAYAPGKDHVYSCLNYLTLSHLVTRVTGRSQHVLLRQRLWKPLGMTDTSFFPNRDQYLRSAPTIYNEKEFRRAEVHDPLAWYSASRLIAPGNAGCFGTVDDMSRYVRMILNGGRWEGREIFRPDIWEQITTDQTGDLGAYRSCGWGIASSDAYRTERNREPGNECLIHTGYTGNLVWIDKHTQTYLIFYSNAVYPDDNKAHKAQVIQARRKIVQTLLEQRPSVEP